MKTQCISFQAVVWLILAAMGQLSAQDGTSMAPILKDASPYIVFLEEKGFEIVRMEFDIINGTETTFRTLHNGWEYGVIAFGDYRIADIDVKVYKKIGSQWVLISEDEKSDSEAVVTVKPSYTGEYKIEIIPYEFKDGYRAAHYGLIIFHE